jgi:hypothetical protein
MGSVAGGAGGRACGADSALGAIIGSDDEVVDGRGAQLAVAMRRSQGAGRKNAETELGIMLQSRALSC